MIDFYFATKIEKINRTFDLYSEIEKTCSKKEKNQRTE